MPTYCSQEATQLKMPWTEQKYKNITATNINNDDDQNCPLNID